MADKQGKRVAAKAEKVAKPPKEKKNPAGKVLLILVLLVVGGYLALCGWVAASGMLAIGDARFMGFDQPIGNLNEAKLRVVVDDILEEFGDQIVTFQQGNQTVVFDKSIFAYTADSFIGSAGNGRLAGYIPFYLYGFEFIKNTVSGPQIIVVSGKSIVNQAAYDRNMAELAALASQSEGHTSYELQDDALHFVKGTSYQTLNEDKVLDFLFSFEVLRNQDKPLEVPVVVKSADEFDMNTIAQQVYIEPVSAVFDLESKSILPHVTGVSLNVAMAQAAYDSMPEGSRFAVALTLTEPEMTAEGLEASLFRDVLGSSDTYVGGVANRVSNVRVMANAVNEMVLLPGDVFSYLAVMNSQRSRLLDAPVYIRGETVEDLGGGVCQVSSMIYYSVFHANLKVVQRAQHAYVVGYIRDGLDATVFNPSPDFKFENDTEYPIKIVSTMEGRNLSIQILGTKSNDWVVSFERAYSDQNPYVTLYEYSDTAPVGSVEELVSGYTGVKVVVWKVIHDGEGNLISRTLESTNNYRRRDRVLLINPVDAAQHGQEPPAGTVLPPVEPTPEVPVEPVPVEPTPEPPFEPIEPPVEVPVEVTPEVAAPEGIPAE